MLSLALLFSDLLARIHPLSIVPALMGMAAIGAWPWRYPSLQVAVGLCLALAVLGDGVSLTLLPRKGRSYGPVTPPLLALAFLRMALAFGLGILSPTLPMAIGTALLQISLTAVQVYATWVEPFRLTVTPLEIPSPKLQSGEPLRILHLSDIHFEGWTPREHHLLETARALSPDLIFLTGDYLNLSSVDNDTAREGARDLLTQLASIAPTYAVIGSPPVDRPDIVPAIFAGLPIAWLIDEIADVEIKGHHLRLIGVRCTADHRRDGERLRRLWDETKSGEGLAFRILLYHSPDLFPLAAELGIDLHLAGHTHGGQLRLPLFGAIFTSSAFWKRYEAGLYKGGESILYVSRGIGVEGKGAPRARFLAPPEIVLVTLRTEKQNPVVV
ncbi:MAG: metallophosphoesterase [Anaerolineae bacterium]|nr:metallophosphoesterase [Anaerolineae bacterium]MCX8066403.1 metallophosphoesterase [Anaerolineae bacterium]MDW7991370.1 metallophosphoesterase [Anaerolineae bacterium]